MGSAVLWIATTIGGLALFLLLLPRRRARDETAPAELVAASVLATEGGALPPISPIKRAPALANVPTLEDESVARWLHPSDEEADFRPSGPSGPPSGTIKRRTQPRARTTRDLQSGH